MPNVLSQSNRPLVYSALTFSKIFTTELEGGAAAPTAPHLARSLVVAWSSDARTVGSLAGCCCYCCCCCAADAAICAIHTPYRDSGSQTTGTVTTKPVAV